MAYYSNIGLLILNKDKTKFLTVQKYPYNINTDYIIPGGLFQESTVEECIKNEIKEELNCEVNFDSLQFVGAYQDVASGRPEKKVAIKLYMGELVGCPKPSFEIQRLCWIGEEDINNPKVSPIIKNKIIPDLVKKKILLSS